MGDLKGHVAPGSFFLFYGVWWAFNCLRRYFKSHRDGTKYKSTASFEIPCICCSGSRCSGSRCSSWPVEGIVKIGMTLFGNMIEICWHLPVLPMPIVQHVTMYCFFMMSGLVDIALHFNVPLPPGSDYMALTLAFVVEGLLFANHLHGRPILDVQIHLLLVYVVVVTVVVIILECRFRDSPLLTLCRAYLVMLQGTWFYGVGYILYGHGGQHLNTAWKKDDPEEAMLATIYFSWHCAANFIVIFLMALCMSFYYVGCRPSRRIAKKHIGNGDTTHFTKLLDQITDDEEEEV